jgi:serine protease DegS
MLALVLLMLVPNLTGQHMLDWDFFRSAVPNRAPLSYSHAVNMAGPAVVNIYSSDIQNPLQYGPNSLSGSRNSTRLGSGVIMDVNGYILTNFHVVQDADLIEVVLQDGQVFPAELIGQDIITDLAVLKVAAVNLPVIPQHEALLSSAGDIVLAIGNPWNLGQTVTQGIISATGRNGLSNIQPVGFLQMDAAINQGNSGGALVNTNGELVGITSRKFTNPQFNIQGIFFAVPYRLAAKIMRKIIRYGRVTRGWLGISANRYDDNLKGVIISSLDPSGPAFDAGLAIGDVIYQIAEQPLISTVQALDIVAETPPDTELIFKIYRQNQQLDIPVTIAKFTI